ncbi:O-antigen/teichoic acid export membrane protein [Haloferula luteola]|uniref:O-antigen/teichoic acid export membrane protein n=1 Tax=Haloferula luteola TaxID=595692 RepID=A0A840UXE0_9BACT|nr:oligosaccharide flippase family protein [Haloferula luteola]MBB5350827.1 O-antigen/teichoic acid export membrane protein [Haloferula luteola]
MHKLLKSDFAKNVKYAGVARLFQITSNIVILGYVVKAVGLEQWGILTYSLSVVTVLSLLQLSISAAAAKRLGDFFHARNFQAFNQYLSATIYSIVALVGILASIFIGVYISGAASHFEGDNQQAFRQVYLATATNALLQIIALPAIAVLQSQNKTHLVSKATLMGNIVRSILVFSIFPWFKEITVYSMILATESLSVLLVVWYQSVKSLHEIPVQLVKVSMRFVWDMLSFNLFNLLNNLVYILFIQAPVFIISHKYGNTAVGVYGLGVQLNSVIRQAISVFVVPLTAQFNVCNAKGKHNELLKIYQVSSLVFVFAAAALVVNVPYAQWGLHKFLNVSYEELDFFSWFIVFIAVSILHLPSSLLTVTFEKVKTTSFVGLASVTLMASVLHYMGGEVNHVGISMALFFLIYDLYRVHSIRKDVHPGTKRNDRDHYIRFTTYGVMIVSIIATQFGRSMIVPLIIDFILGGLIFQVLRKYLKTAKVTQLV